MPQVSLVARFTVKRGNGDALLAAFRPLLDQAGQEPGTLLYVLNRSKDDPDAFWTCELYADDAAFAAHTESDAMAAAAPVMSALIAESDVIVGTPVLAKRTPG